MQKHIDVHAWLFLLPQSFQPLLGGNGERIDVHISPPVCHVCRQPCVRLHLCVRGRKSLFILIVFYEGPMCRIHNNSINPRQQQQKQRGCNLYGNAASMVASRVTLWTSLTMGSRACVCVNVLQWYRDQQFTNYS